MKQCYVPKEFSPDVREVIDQANAILAKYETALTIRQLYYQFVALGYTKDWDSGANTKRSYERVVRILGQARLAGVVDWDDIEDRTRDVQTLTQWESAEARIASAARSFRLGKWKTQPRRVECWIEKDALLGVFEPICEQWTVPLYSCRGWDSLSARREAAQRCIAAAELGQQTVILYFGDHDPSGVDMTRDVRERLEMFGARSLEVERLALNMDQIRQYRPPSLFAKESDSRTKGYKEEYGNKCWELDALRPGVLTELAETAIKLRVDSDAWAGALRKEERERRKLRKLAGGKR